MFFGRDLFFMHEPLRRYWSSVLSSGHLPFLNTALNLGEPILANPINSVLYPGNVLYMLLPFGAAWNVLLAGHVLWAALGLYWLARKLDCPPPAALAGAVVFGFCGPLVSSLNYYNLLIAASWIPWAAGCALMAWNVGGVWSAATAGALAVQILAGEPTIVVLTAGLLSGGYLVGLIREPWRYRTVLARGAFIAVVAALLASIQIVPTLAWLPESGRAGGLPFRESAAYWSLHPARLAEYLVPQMYGNPAGRLASEFWGGAFSDSGLPLITKIYSGWLPLLLLPLALRSSLGRWAVLVFASSVVLAFGHRLPGYHLLYNGLAPFRMLRYPEKFTILASFALAVATALALAKESLPGSLAPRTRVVPAIAVAAILIALLPVLAFVLPHGALSPEQRAEQLHSISQAAIVGVVCALLLVLSTIPRYKRLAAGLIPLVIVLDLASVTWDVARTRSRDESDARPALLTQLPDILSTPIVHLGEQQIDGYFSTPRDPYQSMHDALHPFTGLRWGVAYGGVDDIDRMGWKTGAARQRFVHQALLTGSNAAAGVGPPASEALSIMHACGIGRVVSLAPINTAGLHDETTLSLQNGPTLHVYASDGAPAALVRNESGEGTLTWKEESPQRISISSDAAVEHVIVVARNALPGWRASSDGPPIVLSATHEGLVRISVPAGTHHIVLEYIPPGLRTGALLTLTGLVVVGLSVRKRKQAS
jgi:hypothetical protein